MGASERGVSKLYRKLVTSSDVKAFLIFEKCDESTKQILKEKLAKANSTNAQDILKKIQNV
ncbi:hypothetical protein [Aquibacillus sediminis]|uniref:hypothetical protein n=1 Tax=Aquibacillus sediminis TaxID=2574734 RepID=UPI001107F187|nr:hypothetical protein [Aquibacillus sediminis]